MQGWVALHRHITSKAIWKKSTPEHKVILITLLTMANHEEAEWEWQGQEFKVMPGQFITSLESIKIECGKGISFQNIRSAIDRFQKLGFLTNESTKTGRLITILNWGKYQVEMVRGNKANNKEVTKNQQRGNKEVTTNNNDKNNKNDNNDNKKRDSSPPTPYQQIIDLYHQYCQSMPKVKVLTDKRKDTIRVRWKKYNSLEVYQELFKKAEDSDFLTGRSGKWTGCNFDWLLNEANMVKVLEGNYDNRASPGQANVNEALRLVEKYEKEGL